MGGPGARADGGSGWGREGEGEGEGEAGKEEGLDDAQQVAFLCRLHCRLRRQVL
jgi:hypothetical protein